MTSSGTELGSGSLQTLQGAGIGVGFPTASVNPTVNKSIAEILIMMRIVLQESAQYNRFLVITVPLLFEVLWLARAEQPLGAKSHCMLATDNILDVC
jgi:hypothetical protein